MQTDKKSSQELPLVYVLGDSISIQYGPYLESFLEGFFRYERKSGEAEALLNLDNPAGANGGDSNRVLKFLRSFLKNGSRDIDIIMLNCGLHDIRRELPSKELQVPLKQYGSNLNEVIGLIQAANALPIWVRTTDIVDALHNIPARNFHRYANDLIEYNALADEIMTNRGVASIDLYTFTRNLGPAADIFCDHVHYHDFVRERQAAFIAGALTGLDKLSSKT